MMQVPDGYTEQEVLDAITRAVNGLVSNFRFGYFDEDDLRQEGFMYACEALPRFDPENERGCGLENFLRIHVRNRFINLRRNKLHRNTPPCSSCLFQDKQRDSGCAEFSDRSECPKWSGWNARNQAKRSLVETCDATNVTHVTPMDELDICTRISRNELLEYVSRKIPLAFRADYCRLVEGAKLSKAKRDAVIEAVRAIAGEILYDEEEAWSH